VATIHLQEGKHIEAKISEGVRQGCNLSPILLNMYMEEAIKEIEEQEIKVNGEEINMLRLADDISKNIDKYKVDRPRNEAQQLSGK
jgi:hypothetical protein